MESTTEADSNDMKSSWDYRPIGMFGFFLILHSMIHFLSRVSILTRYIDIANCLSICLSVRNVPVSNENGLPYRHSFFHFTLAQSF